MALINRIGRLFRADMHAVLDRLEEPDALLKQAVREMEESINNRQSRLRQLQHQRSQLQDRMHDLEQTLSRTRNELELCLDSDNETLARKLIKRRLESERFTRFMARRMSNLDVSIKDIMQSLAEQRNRLTSVKQKQELLSEEQQAFHEEEYVFPDNISVSDDDVEVALLREKQLRTST